MLGRRSFVGLAGSAAALACRGGEGAPGGPESATARSEVAVVRPSVATQTAGERPTPISREVGRTGERLPAIGMGTWETFDVGADEGARAPLREVLRVFTAGGGRVIDTSPMYGAAEQVTGDLVEETGARPFLATKVWTRGREAGVRQMEASLRLLRVQQVDLMQVHNLLDLAAHLPTLRVWKEAGKVRYIGATHYQRGAFDELERAIREEPLDFVQLPYSLGMREAERRLLPAAAERGLAVLVMRPFEGGELFARVRGRALPGWAAELGCASWAQIFLKFILGHPAVHCPLPATRNPKHMADNMGAGFGRLPDASERRRMISELGF